MRIREGLPWRMLPGIFALAWPTMLEQMMHTVVQYIDIAMVGTLGTQATAAVGATSTITWLVGSTIEAVGIGLLAYVSQACGAGNHKMVSKASSQAVLVALLLGTFFTALTLSLSNKIPVWMQVDESIRSLAGTYFFVLYSPMLARTAMILFGALLRAAGDTRTPMRVGVAVNIFNVILNFLMIYPSRKVVIGGINFIIPGAGWGVIGAGIASAMAFWIGGILITVALWKHPLVSPKGRSIKPDWAILKPCLKVAIPNALQRFATSFGYVAFASMINALGDIATAAHTVANTVESAFYIPGYGMQAAASTLTGNAYGAQDGKRIRDVSKMILAIEISLMAVSGFLLFMFAPQMMGIFAKNQQVIHLGSIVLRMVAVSEPFFGVSIIIEGMLHGLGKTGFPFAVNVAGMWGIRIVGTFICTKLLGMGLIAAWACMILHNVLLFTVYSVYYCSGKWNPLRNKAI